jgi:two-component system, chemotaxis family, protein-glutamate methylesterase/glutaminase
MKGKKKYHAIIIGGSAGSIEITAEILHHLPAQISPAIIIVIHRMRNTKSNIERLFLSGLKIKHIKEADEKEEIRPGHIYIAPANYHLLIDENKTFTLDYSELVNFSRPSIDVTMESAAAVFKDKLIAVLLSGANNDGSAGIHAVKQYGGVTIVQEPADAEYEAMPKAAIQKMKPDFILPVEEIKKEILKLIT